MMKKVKSKINYKVKKRRIQRKIIIRNSLIIQIPHERWPSIVHPNRRIPIDFRGMVCMLSVYWCEWGEFRDCLQRSFRQEKSLINIIMSNLSLVKLIQFIVVVSYVILSKYSQIPETVLQNHEVFLAMKLFVKIKINF